MSEIGVRGVPSHHPMRIEVICDFAYRVFHQNSINEPQKYAAGKYYYHSKRNAFGSFGL